MVIDQFKVLSSFGQIESSKMDGSYLGGYLLVIGSLRLLVIRVSKLHGTNVLKHYGINILRLHVIIVWMYQLMIVHREVEQMKVTQQLHHSLDH